MVDVTDSLDAIQGNTLVLNSPVKIYGEDNIACFTVTPNTDVNGTSLSVVSNNSTDAICSKAQILAKKSGIIDSLSQSTLRLGGQSIIF